MSFAVDASVALAWLIDTERTPATDALLDRAAANGAIAPSLLLYEIANRLGRARRRKELTQDQIRELMRGFGALDLELVQTDVVTLVERMATTDLTAYDAAYLDIAVVRGIPLATLDRGLRAAAEAEGVEVLPR